MAQQVSAEKDDALLRTAMLEVQPPVRCQPSIPDARTEGALQSTIKSAVDTCRSVDPGIAPLSTTSKRTPPSFDMMQSVDDAALAKLVLSEAVVETPKMQRTTRFDSLHRQRMLSLTAQDVKDDAVLANILKSQGPALSGNTQADLNCSGDLVSMRTTSQQNHDDRALFQVLGEDESNNTAPISKNQCTSKLQSNNAALADFLRKLSKSVIPDDHVNTLRRGWSELPLPVANLLHRIHYPIHIEVVAGGHGRGNSLNQLCRPLSVALDGSDAVLVAESGNGRITRWPRGQSHGEFVRSTYVGADMWIDLGRDGKLIVVDNYNHFVARWAKSEESGVLVAEGISRWQPRDLRGAIPISNSAAAAVNKHGEDDAMLIVDSGNHRVLRMARGAKHAEVIAGGNGQGNALDQLSHPRDVAVEDASCNSILVADMMNHRVMRWRRGATSGEIVAGGRDRGSRLNQLNRPTGLALDKTGALFISDSGNHRILRCTAPVDFV